MLHQYIRATASSLLLMSCYWLYIYTGKLEGNKEPLLLDNDLCIMVHQRCPEAASSSERLRSMVFAQVKERGEPLAIIYIIRHACI